MDSAKHLLIIKEARELLGDNRAISAIDLLKSNIEDQKIIDELILFRAQIEQSTRQLHLSEGTNELIQVAKNRAVDGVLYCCTRLESRLSPTKSTSLKLDLEKQMINILNEKISLLQTTDDFDYAMKTLYHHHANLYEHLVNAGKKRRRIEIALKKYAGDKAFCKEVNERLQEEEKKNIGLIDVVTKIGFPDDLNIDEVIRQMQGDISVVRNWDLRNRHKEANCRFLDENYQKAWKKYNRLIVGGISATIGIATGAFAVHSLNPYGEGYDEHGYDENGNDYDGNNSDSINEIDVDGPELDFEI